MCNFKLQKLIIILQINGFSFFEWLYCTGSCINAQNQVYIVVECPQKGVGSILMEKI